MVMFGRGAGVAAGLVVAGVAAALMAVNLTPGGSAGSSANLVPAEGTAPTAATASYSPPERRVKQKASLAMHPQIADAGKASRSASAADSAMTAQFKPARKGRTVQLQRKKGSRWVTVSKAKQDKKGRVEMTAPFKHKGKVATYRVRAVPARGLPAKTSKGVSAGRWGQADLTTDFTGTSLPAEWDHRITEYDDLRQCAITADRPETLQVGSGVLRLGVIDDPDRGGVLQPPPAKCETDYGDFDWRLTGMVSTEETKAFKYGYAAARIKFQPRAGQHGSFWLQPASKTAPYGSPKETGAEIDVVEWFGDRKNDDTELASFAHYYPTADKSVKVCGLIKNHKRYGKGWANRYHVFSVEWTKKHYIFRIDGRETCRTTKGISARPQFLILSLQANIYEIPLLDGDREAPHETEGLLPQHMYVDWVRYWQP